MLTPHVCRYFVVGELAGTEAEVIRIAGLLRATESAVQAVSVRTCPSRFPPTRSSLTPC